MPAKIKVYLNEGENRFMGFHDTRFGEPRLRLAASFEIPADSNLPLTTDWLHRQLEHIFEQLNVGGDLVEAEPWTVQYRKERNRSLSVGDVVVLGETAMACESAGWVGVAGLDLTTAIDRFKEKGAYER